MRSFVLACALLSALAPAALAAPTGAALQKAVVEGYAKVDNLSISCWFDWGFVSGGVVGGTVEYRFDRRAKELAIGILGIPVVLVKDNQAFLLLWRDKNKRPTYLEIEKDRAISWKDIDAASLAIRKECGPYTHWIDDPFFAVRWDSLAPCFVAPFLDGGKEKLFSQGTKVLTIDPKLLNPDQEEVLQQLLETDKINDLELMVFVMGHPNSFETERPKLDPERFPTCFKTEDESSSWIYAFDQHAGMLSAAAGTINCEQVLGCPGNDNFLWIRKIAAFRDGTIHLNSGKVFKVNDELMPVPLQLPEDAKTIGISDLRRSYLEMMSKTGMEVILKRKADLEGNLREAIQVESDVMAEMSRQSADPAKDRENLEETRLHLGLARGNKQKYTYVLAELQKLIDELRKEASFPKNSSEGKRPADERGSSKNSGDTNRY